MENIKLIDKYISKQLLETFLIGVVIFTSILFASDTFITLVKQISMYGIPIQAAILAVILKLPSMLVMTIPMGVLMSTVMTINKLSTSSEIAVMRACGISIARIARPAFAFALAAVIGTFLLNEVIVPAANAQARNVTLWALTQKNIPDGSKNFSFKELKANNMLKRLFYIDSCEKKKLHGVTVLDTAKEGTVQVIQSRYGSTSPEHWKFNKGIIYTISMTGKVLNTTVFDNLKLKNNFSGAANVNKHKAREYSVFGLIKFFKENKDLSKEKLVEYSIELQNKFAMPLTALVFVLVGFPLAITPPRVRFNRGFLFSILVIFCYYVISAFSSSLGLSGGLAPFWAAWMPNIILSVIGAFLFYRKAFKI